MIKTKQTYVFDFYNLYILKGKSYINKKEGIRIEPLKFAEEFEKNRTKLSSQYSRNNWKTAKCYISSKSEQEAKARAMLLEHLYSFAQNRTVFFVRWYPYKKGKKHFSSESKFIEPRENRFSELINGTKIKGAIYTRDISLFMDTSIQKIIKLEKNKKEELVLAIHSYNISKSDMIVEMKFLLCWILLEKLANSHYNMYKLHKSERGLFSKDKTEKIKSELQKTLNKLLKNDDRLDIVKESVTRNFLYEHPTREKMMLYLKSLDLGFDVKKLENKIKELIKIRAKLVHNLYSEALMKKIQNLYYLQKIVERVILRNLGIDKCLEKRFIINQYRGNEL